MAVTFYDESNPFMHPPTDFTNRLAGETSPYLLQHAHNPVDWHPWGEEALQLARREGKPVLLSIGYSACHWCHVMAHESFEDAATAERMNALFVNIKVDREERPDLDKIYQLSHQLLSRRNGGWPLTVFLDPRDLLPFFTGTYFPKASRYNLPDFLSVLAKVSEFYQANKDKLGDNKASLLNALNSLNADRAGSNPPDANWLAEARRHIGQYYDWQHGGFGGAPKFPHASTLDFLLRHAARTGDGEAMNMAVNSLRQMALGGIYDQLGGGFCRYSVDAAWHIPHFEKMLYDNGPLLGLYSQAWQITGDELFRRVAAETAAWALREMRSPEGGFYSSLDADSEGEEGRYYVWSHRQVQAILSEAEYALLALHYGLTETPNFEGHWHLYVAVSLGDAAQRLNLTPDEAAALLDSARCKLLGTRQGRVRPGCDDKILTAWNALMIKGLAIAGRVFGQVEWVNAAAAAMAFLHQNIFDNGTLFASWKAGRARFPAYLDDTAFLLDAALELLQSRWNGATLTFAIELADDLLARFADGEGGGFFFTAHDHERLIHRPKAMTDESMPSGNGVAAAALHRLGHWLGEPRYLEAAERTLQVAATGIQSYPLGYGALLVALEEWCSPPQTVVIRGKPAESAAWLASCQSAYNPNRACLAIPDDAPALPGLLAERRPADYTVAYICTGTSCQPPVTRLEELPSALDA